MIKYLLSFILLAGIHIYTFSQNYVSGKYEYCVTDFSNHSYSCSVHQLNSSIEITGNELHITNSELLKKFQITGITTQGNTEQYTLIDPSGELAFFIIQTGEATIHYDRPENNPVYRFYLNQ